MKLSNLLFSTLVILLAACSSDADHFSGVWQSVNDPSRQIIFTSSGKTYSFETRNIKTSLQGIPGTYNAKEHALEFDNGKGDTIQLVYNASVKHIVGLDDEFEKATTAAAEKEDDKGTGEAATEETKPEETASSETTTNCDKGDILVISGNNVRVRNEPDVTKQNILFQVHKGYEVIHLDDKNVDGQKWYKVCYDGNIGWVSGQYAAKK
ncbi:MAG TPA: SH3 domain-containing protein [Saprospiraceae bacterium]|nr:SH3 domain-containing protein [Saprospiraceae bacterium]